MARMKGFSRVAHRDPPRGAQRAAAGRRPPSRSASARRSAAMWWSRRCSAGPGSAGCWCGGRRSHDYPLAQGAFLIIALVLVADEFHRRPALHGARSAGGAWRRLNRPSPARAGWRRCWPCCGAWRMPLRDPFAFAGITDLRRCSCWWRCSPTCSRRTTRLEILFTKDGKLAANVPPGARLPARHHQSRPRHLFPAVHRHAQRARWSG